MDSGSPKSPHEPGRRRIGKQMLLSRGGVVKKSPIFGDHQVEQFEMRKFVDLLREEASYAPKRKQLPRRGTRFSRNE